MRSIIILLIVCIFLPGVIQAQNMHGRSKKVNRWKKYKQEKSGLYERFSLSTDLFMWNNNEPNLGGEFYFAPKWNAQADFSTDITHQFQPNLESNDIWEIGINNQAWSIGINFFPIHTPGNLTRKAKKINVFQFPCLWTKNSLKIPAGLYIGAEFFTRSSELTISLPTEMTVPEEFDLPLNYTIIQKGAGAKLGYTVRLAFFQVDLGVRTRLLLSRKLNSELFTGQSSIQFVHFNNEILDFTPFLRIGITF